jgi:hypothetical protein
MKVTADISVLRPCLPPRKLARTSRQAPESSQININITDAMALATRRHLSILQ